MVGTMGRYGRYGRYGRRGRCKGYKRYYRNIGTTGLVGIGLRWHRCGIALWHRAMASRYGFAFGSDLSCVCSYSAATLMFCCRLLPPMISIAISSLKSANIPLEHSACSRLTCTCGGCVGGVYGGLVVYVGARVASWLAFDAFDTTPISLGTIPPQAQHFTLVRHVAARARSTTEGATHA